MRPLKYCLIAAFSSLPYLAAVNGAEAKIVIVVDEQAQTMAVDVDGTPAYRWKVSTGRSGHDTPTGDFHPFRMERDHFSKEWDDAPMPHSIFFTQEGHAIHGSLATRQLGKAASHGCIRLAPENAAILYNLVEAEGLPNTEVIITNGGRLAVAEKNPGSSLFASEEQVAGGYEAQSGELY